MTDHERAEDPDHHPESSARRSKSDETIDRSLLNRVVYARDRSQLRATWRILAVFAVTLPLYYGANLGLPVLVRTSIESDPSQTVLLAATLGVFVGLAVLITAAAVVALVVASRVGAGSPSYGFEWSTKWGRDVVGGVAIGAVATVIALVYATARGTWRMSVAPSGVGAQSFFVAGVVVVVLLVFLAANNVFEEVVFRGIFITTAVDGLQSRSLGLTPAVLLGVAVSMPLFGLFHVVGGPSGIVTSMFAGALFGVAYVLTGRLGLPIGIHFGGAVTFAALSQEQFDGFTVPSLVVADPLIEPSLIGAVEVWTVRALAGVVLVCLWVRIYYGKIGVSERFATESQ